jgi:hypothetical protein
VVYWILDFGVGMVAGGWMAGDWRTGGVGDWRDAFCFRGLSTGVTGTY